MPFLCHLRAKEGKTPQNGTILLVNQTFISYYSCVHVCIITHTGCVWCGSLTLPFVITLSVNQDRTQILFQIKYT